ncbi:MAG: allantoate amidohydrolase [Acetobacteraceae bacterium]|nr:allantoate amidohydrolase [Acetobacteraceae bacterium]
MDQEPGEAPAPATERTAASGRALGAGIMRRLEDLARFSADGSALTRLYLTPQHKAAALRVRTWMREAGMAAEIDTVGNVVGRYEGATPGAPALLLGSHIDTVRNAGRYDGNLGVVVAIEAVAALHARRERLPFAVEVIAFGDEEGVRFPVTLTGSRAVAGTFDPAALEARDAEGVGLREALRSFGGDPGGIPRVARRREDALAYVEAHIEQGPVLETEGLPVGVVTAISGATRLTAEVEGTAGHAGTVPMALRQDALAAAAEMVLLVERTAVETPDLVATVGRIEATPGAVNVIPSGARFTIDIRSPNDATRNGAVERLREEMEAMARRRGVGLRLEKTYDEAAAVCAPALVEQLGAAVARATGLRPRLLPSGAGHDGLAMIALCPIGMLFVRCGGGISHNPAESITTEDADAAARVLLDFLRHFRPPPL